MDAFCRRVPDDWDFGSWNEVEKNHPLLGYAANNWNGHMHAQDDKTTQDMAFDYVCSEHNSFVLCYQFRGLRH